MVWTHTCPPPPPFQAQPPQGQRWPVFRYWFGFTAEFKGRHKGVTRQSVEKGETETRTERSLFRRTDGVWRFVDSPDEFCNSGQGRRRPRPGTREGGPACAILCQPFWVSCFPITKGDTHLSRT